METWMWVSLWILQTFIGAVLMRRFSDIEVEGALFCSAIIIGNIVGLIAGFISLTNYCFGKLCFFVDFLAGKRNKTE
jgi:hypothetical protein